MSITCQKEACRKEVRRKRMFGKRTFESQIMAIAAVSLVALFGSPLMAKNLTPYVLASESSETLKQVKATVKTALKEAGFQIVGGFAPKKGAYLYVVTNREMKQRAGATQYGAFGATTRVSMTKVNAKVQISYSNPPYWAAAFRMKGSLTKTAKSLKEALGYMKGFGSEDGLSDAELRKYHYMFMMPYFDDIEEIGQAQSHEAALQIIDANLKAKKAGARLVYKVNIPGTSNTIYGIHFRKGAGADHVVLKSCDIGPIKQTAYAPFELLVIGNQVIALQGRFRLAVSFPDLSKKTFMNIAGAPGAIHDALVEISAP